MGARSRRIKSWVRTKWEMVLIFLLIVVVVPQVQTVFKQHRKRNKHKHSSPTPVPLAQKTKIVVISEDDKHDDYSDDIVNVADDEKHWDKVEENIQEENDISASQILVPSVDNSYEEAELDGEEHTTQLPPTEKPFIPVESANEGENSQKPVNEKTNILRGSADVWTPDQIKTDDELFETALGMDMGKLPNPEFIYHNKLPKCGSTTMHAILGVLSRWNSFRYLKLEPSLVKFFDGEKMSKLITTLVENKKVSKPFFIFKHHYYFNASMYELETPTWINVIRDPLSWFESNFYFKRFGWERQPGSRRRDDQDLTIDKCVETGHEDCKKVKWKYNQFLCGNAPVCTGHSPAEKQKAAELAKHNIANNFFLVGILEQFIDTLHVFEKLMPAYYSRAVEALNSQGVQQIINATKTQHKTPMSDASKNYFRNGPLRHEIDVYNFAKRIFNEKMKRAGIDPFVKPPNN